MLHPRTSSRPLSGRQRCSHATDSVRNLLPFELLLLPRVLRRKTAEQIVELEGGRRIDEVVRTHPDALLVTGHVGNWELLGAVLATLGYPTHYMAKRQRNPLVDAYLESTRRRLGVGVLHPGAEVRRVFRNLREGGLIGVVADQDGGPDGVFVDVLGKVASVYPGAAVFALRTGAPARSMQLSTLV